MLSTTVLRLLSLSALTQICFTLPVTDSPFLEERDPSAQFLPGAGQTAQEAEGTIQSEQSQEGGKIPNEKRTPFPAISEEEFPLTHAVMKMIRNAIPEAPAGGLEKRQNDSTSTSTTTTSSSGGGIIDKFNALDPQTQTTLKQTIQYGAALVMKTGAWALSP